MRTQVWSIACSLPMETGARCLQNKDNGRTCRRSQAIQWFYNRQVKRCAVFWYGGCDGNGNRIACVIPGVPSPAEPLPASYRHLVAED
uniref:BPTI/Kunitz inhibitor domain-containing protein n=1 Tax=Paramormyrops kingsleyae TaxID=1676925 RepID=A0A3B3STS1_9TELE